MMSMITTAGANAIGKKRALPVAEAVLSGASSVVAAGHDDDGEEILVEAEPLPHEIATDPALRCRYPSKHCLRTRTVKKTGTLHSMCAFHRAKANRNQRRLEKRKRLRLNSTGSVTDLAALAADQQMTMKQEPSPTTLLMPAFSSSFKEFLDKSSPSSLAPQFRSPREVASEFEPFRTPAALFPEDLEELCELVDVSVRQTHACPSEDDFRLLSQLLL
ncbi:hypothetical protein V7S43_018139 [Phytophthora oleae]|uniref:Uncharacterized protein n=1 Tax=Phytophthora oleae TaxID=2107226 RepID=A0ABD3EV05_9STRA